MLNRAEKIQLPDKLYFKISEVSKYTGVKAHVLRYWESNFDEIKPIRRNSQRLYDRRAINNIFKIKNMLYEQNYTIAGAKKKLEHNKTTNHKQAKSSDRYLIEEILSELKTLKKLLK